MRGRLKGGILYDISDSELVIDNWGAIVNNKRLV